MATGDSDEYEDVVERLKSAPMQLPDFRDALLHILVRLGPPEDEKAFDKRAARFAETKRVD